MMLAGVSRCYHLVILPLYSVLVSSFFFYLWGILFSVSSLFSSLFLLGWGSFALRFSYLLGFMVHRNRIVFFFGFLLVLFY